MSNWLVRYNEEEAIFRRPSVDRLVYGALLVFMSCFLWMLIVLPYTGTTVDKEHLPLDFVISFVTILPLSFASGPKEMRFDFRQKRFQGKIGFFFLSWTRSGDFSEISHLAVWNNKFTGLSIEWKNLKRTQTTFVSCSTKSEAQSLAARLGTDLNVPVKAGVVKNLRRPTK